MNGIDILLQQAIIAAFFWTIINTYAQRKWRLFSTFFGKKWGTVVAIAIYSLAWAQVLVTMAIVFKSTWRVPAGYFVGTLVLAGALFLLYNQKTIPFRLNSTLKFKAIIKLHIPFALLFLGLGLASGQLGFELAAVTYAICGLIHAAIIGRLAK